MVFKSVPILRTATCIECKTSECLYKVHPSLGDHGLQVNASMMLVVPEIHIGPEQLFVQKPDLEFWARLI